MAPQLTRSDYTVSWISALHIEFAAAQKMLDEKHPDLAQDTDDENTYVYGRIHQNNVVLVCLPNGQTGVSPATAVATHIKRSFRSIRFGLVVGIGGGVPSAEADIRLGDVVVSQQEKGYGGVIQYDFGKITPNKIERKGFLGPPPKALSAAVSKVRSMDDLDESKLSDHIAKLTAVPKFAKEKAGSDMLFERNYDHVGGLDCSSCNRTKEVKREPREHGSTVVHYGTIASGNQVMKDAKTRDQISSEFKGVLCFEMEAAGLMNDFPCLVIRGICDYADSHKNDAWQPYAAAVAAAYAKELLSVLPKAAVDKIQTVEEATPTPYFSLPFPENEKFVGRKSDIQTLENMLFLEHCRRVAVFGLGGIGKTQVTLSFAYRVKRKRPEFSIFWVSAVSSETVLKTFGEIAKNIGIYPQSNSKEDVRETVQRHLSKSTAGNWLLIVDNADDEQVLYGTGVDGEGQGLLDYLPTSQLGFTIFTTRNQVIAQGLVGREMIEIGKMELEEAVDLLRTRLRRRYELDDESATSALMEELDSLPLAITQAAAYMNSGKTSIARYVELLKNTEEDLVHLLHTELRDNTRHPQAVNAVAKTWVTSFRQIEERDVFAVMLLVFISHIEWKDIPLSILPPGKLEAKKHSAIDLLCSFSFLTKRPDEDKYDMHRLVHLACRVWRRQNPAHTHTMRQVMQHLLKVYPFDPDARFASRMRLREYLPHIIRVIRYCTGQNVVEKAELCRLAGQFMIEEGRSEEAILWLEYAYKTRSLIPAEDYRIQSDSHTLLAQAYQSTGQTSKAVKILELAVNMYKSFPENHVGRTEIIRRLADAYTHNGQILMAVERLEEIVKVQKRSVGRRFSRIAAILEHMHAERSSNQIFTGWESKRNLEANEAWKEIKNLLSSQLELGMTYEEGDRITDAIAMLQLVVPLLKLFSPENHLTIRMGEMLLAETYTRNGQATKAIEILECAINTDRSSPEDDASRLTTQIHLARAYAQIRQIRKGIEVLESAIPAQKVSSASRADLVTAKATLAELHEMERVRRGFS